MAKEWAKKFYASKSWKECREGYKASHDYLCEKCQQDGKLVPGEIVHHTVHLTPQNANDPAVSLNWENLLLVCRECHAVEHDRILRATRPGYAFDHRGRLVRE